MMRHFSLFLFIILFGERAIHAGDNYHFYRPPLGLRETRFEKPALSTFSLAVAHGSNSHYYNYTGTKECLSSLLNNNTRFTISEVQLEWIQNIIPHTFFKVQLPIRSFNISQQQPQRYTTNFRLRGTGDPALSAGVTINYEKTQNIDFLDGTLEAGVTLPLSSAHSFSCRLPLSLGYAGHTGYFIRGAGALGLFDWLTFTANGGCMIFTKNYQQFGCGSSKKSIICCRPGIIGFCDINLIADHFMQGCSFAVQYSYLQQNKFHGINQRIQGPLSGWKMHVISLFLSYDWATYYHRNLPQIAVFANIPVAGNNIIPTTIGGALFGVTIDWCF